MVILNSFCVDKKPKYTIKMYHLVKVKCFWLYHLRNLKSVTGIEGALQNALLMQHNDPCPLGCFVSCSVLFLLQVITCNSSPGFEQGCIHLSNSYFEV